MINVPRRGIFLFLLYIIAPSSVLRTRRRGIIRRGYLFEKRHTILCRMELISLLVESFPSLQGVMLILPAQRATVHFNVSALSQSSNSFDWALSENIRLLRAVWSQWGRKSGHLNCKTNVALARTSEETSILCIFHLTAQDSRLTRDKCTNQPPHLVSADKNLSSYDWPLLMDSHALKALLTKSLSKTEARRI